MSDLRSTLEDIAREATPPVGIADDALRLAARRRARRHWTPAAAAAVVIVVVAAGVGALRLGAASVRPAVAASGPGTVPHSIGKRPAHIESVLTHPIARAAVMYGARDGRSQILISADGDDVRRLPSDAPHGFKGVAYSLSPDGTKVAYAVVPEEFSEVKRGNPGTELRIVTLATGAVERVPLLGNGLGDDVNVIEWVRGGQQLLVQAAETTVAGPGSGRWSGKAVGFTVDVRSGAIGRSVPAIVAPGWGGWSTDGQRFLQLRDNAVGVTDANGNTMTSIPADDVPGSGASGYRQADAWSPDERTAVIVNDTSAAAKHSTIEAGVDKPFVLRAFSLATASSSGSRPVDVSLGAADVAYVVGWADAAHVLVAAHKADGSAEVLSVDVHTGGVSTVMTVSRAAGAGVLEIAQDVVRAGGFR